MEPRQFQSTEEIDRGPQIPARAKAAAVLSLVIWTGVLTMGRLIGYYEGYKPDAPAVQAQVK